MASGTPARMRTTSSDVTPITVADRSRSPPHQVAATPSGDLAKVGQPQRVGVGHRGQQPPVLPPGRARRHPQFPTQLAEQPVSLTVIAQRAAGHAVFPTMLAPSTARHHMVDGFRAGSAIATAVTVPVHQGRPGHRNPRPVRHPHERAQLDHRRGYDAGGRGMQYQARGVTMHDIGLAAHHQHDCPTQRQRGQRLEARIEQQYPSASPDRCARSGSRVRDDDSCFEKPG